MTTLGCERFEEVCALVAVGAALPEEEQALRAHLDEGCPACNAAYRELRETTAHLPKTLTPISPPPTVRLRLLDAIVREAEVTPRTPILQPPKLRRRVLQIPWPWAAGWALAAALGVMLLWNTNTQREAALRYEDKIHSLRLTLEEKEKALELIQARQTQTVQLAGLPPSPNAFGKVFWNQKANAGVLVAFDLPPLPEGKVYQLWAIQGAVPVDAGVFFPDPEGTAALRVKPLSDPRQTIQLFAITVEPAGGSPQPTGEMYLKGTGVSF